jgi:hypothetical protein
MKIEEGKTQATYFSRMATILSPSDSAPWSCHNLLKYCCDYFEHIVQRRTPYGRPVKLLLAFASTVILGFGLLEIQDQDFHFFLDMYVLQNDAPSSMKER